MITAARVTPAEKARVNRQENRLSRQIYRQKHDAQRMWLAPTGRPAGAGATRVRLLKARAWPC